LTIRNVSPRISRVNRINLYRRFDDFGTKNFREHFKLEFNSNEDGCWHGGVENGNCNIGRTLNKCLWWHFYPHETPTDAKKKFLEIVGGGYTVTNIDNSPFFIVKKDEK